ncbi:MAG: acyltransferase family protein [Deltaproteobacteria bacterium]|nr:acyltransferase family protein [Deltaproteobacteria bacterium]
MNWHQLLALVKTVGSAGRDVMEEWLRRSHQDRFGRDEAFVEIIRPFFQFLYYQYFRVSVDGVAHLPTKGRAMIVANHSGTLPFDGTMVALAVFNKGGRTRRPVRFLVDDFVFDLPSVGWVMERLGGLRASRENARAMLDDDQLIAVFPEGVRGVGKFYEDRYQLERFGHGGFVRIAMQTRAPIIPTAIIGAEEIYPLVGKSERLAQLCKLPYFPITPTFPWLGPLGLIPLPTKWKIIFGKPVSFAKARPKDADNQSLVEEKTEAIRGAVQRMITTELAKRKSVWF